MRLNRVFLLHLSAFFLTLILFYPVKAMGVECCATIERPTIRSGTEIVPDTSTGFEVQKNLDGSEYLCDVITNVLEEHQCVEQPLQVLCTSQTRGACLIWKETGRQKVDCFEYGGCIKKHFEDNAASIERSDSEIINVGDLKIIEIISTRTRSPGLSDITLKCLNCDQVKGLSQEGGSGWESRGENSTAMRLKFDTSEFANKNERVIYPTQITLKFFAELDVSDTPKYGYQEIIIPILAPNCPKNNSDRNACIANRFCYWYDPLKCVSAVDPSLCEKFSTKDVCEDKDGKLANTCGWNEDSNECVPKVDKALSDIMNKEYKVPDGYKGPLPACAFSGECRDINKLIELFIKIGDMIFQIVAGFAFIMFVYGGFTWVLSFGNAERVKKGQQILVAAVVGLVIVFSAYLLVDFLLDALGVKETFRGI